MPVEADDHQKLYQYGGIAVIGVIILVLGIQQLSWIISLLGIFAAGYGGFEVRLAYQRIHIQQNHFQIEHKTEVNAQISQTNSTNSPNIGSIGTAYFGTPSPQVEKSNQRVDVQQTSESPGPQSVIESLYHGLLYFDDLEDFHTGVNRGDRIQVEVSADHPISVQIMSDEDFEDFDPDYDDNEVYWSSRKTTNCAYSWPAAKRERVCVAVVNETDLDEWAGSQAFATVRVDVVRFGHAR